MWRGGRFLYADRMTDAMENAIGETSRRRQIQEAHNREHGIEPRSIVKSIRDLTDRMKVMAEDQADYSVEDGGDARAVYLPALSPDELVKKIAALEEEMQEAAQNAGVRARGLSPRRGDRTPTGAETGKSVNGTASKVKEELIGT